MLLSRQSSINSSIDPDDGVYDEDQIISDSMSPKKVKKTHPTLAKLPVHVLYHIMEYMNWDWFVELKKSMTNDESSSVNILIKMIQIHNLICSFKMRLFIIYGCLYRAICRIKELLPNTLIVHT